MLALGMRARQDNPLNTLLEQGAVRAAQDLIGWCFYVVEPDGTKVGGVITETEAYTQEDAASHSCRGETPRTAVMFGPAGHLYVYFTYGMHWCANIVTGLKGHGEAVLIRAIQPDAGLAIIQERRGNRPDAELTNGPAKFCQALAINGQDSGAVVNQGRFLLLPPEGPKLKITAAPRIGITQGTHRLWRFVAVD